MVLLSTSCFVSRQALLESEPAGDFAIWVRYLPETDSDAQFRMSVRPVPMDNGWTDLRMSRDISRMAYCGINAVMVEITPQQLSDAEFLERFRSFSALASKSGLQTVLSLVCDKSQVQPIERQNLLQYLESLGLSSLPGYLQENDRPAFLVSEGFALEDANPELPESVSLMRFGVELPPCPTTPLDENIPLPARFQWIRAAQYLPEIQNSSNQSGWIVPRRRGKNVTKQFLMLRKTECQVALLSSWNDYSDGSFVENNSLDGEMMTNAVKLH